MLCWWRDEGGRYDAIICDGAVRSGKTLSMSLSFFLWAMAGFEGMQFGLCGKTIRSLRRNVLFPILPILKAMGFNCREKVSENLLTVSYRGRENTFYFFGGKDESSAALIQGITLAGALLDEVALMPRSFVEQACARCSVRGSKLWFNCNPEHPQHWFYLEWIKKAEQRRALLLHFTMKDNPSLSPRIISRYKRMYSGVFYRRFVLGEWVAAEGRVYDFFDSGAFVRPRPDGQAESYYISCDYGTVNPASFGLWGLYGGIWYRLEEYYYDSRAEGRQKTDEEYADDLMELAGGRRIAKVVVDPSAASFIETLIRRGLNVVRARNDVLSGIRTTAGLLKDRRLVICEGCADSIREFYLYCWDMRRGGQDAVIKENDHAMDDIRYFAATVAAPVRDDGFTAISVERGTSWIC